MPFDGHRKIGPPHALAVVADGNEPPAASVGENVNARGAGVERVLHQLLDHARWTLDHFAGGDAINDQLGQLADEHWRFAETCTNS